MTDDALLLVGTAGLAAAGFQIVRARSSLQPTTLTAAWRWTALVWIVWGGTWIADSLVSCIPAGLADRLWYLSGLLSLCPFVSVLGARRPGSRVWTWFVLLPMLLVLGWPALFPLGNPFLQRPLQLQLPAACGYWLVMVMGLGNYLGTRFWGPTLLAGLALVLLTTPMALTLPPEFSRGDSWRIAATLCVSLAVLWAGRTAGKPTATRERFQRLWVDFRDWFGIVWAKRILDRWNQTAEQKQWPVRLGTAGLAWVEPHEAKPLPAHVEGEIEQSFRWLLRRFVDAEWIDARLSPNDATTEREGDGA